MSYIQVSVKVSPSEVRDIIIARLSELNFEGFEERDEEIVCSILGSNYKEEAVNNLLQTFNVEHSSETIKEQNWNAVWEANFQPVTIEGFCTIRADFHPSVAGIPYDIIINPKMSFGTGHHATTYMMIQQMQQLSFKDKKVADFGTGTGILSILAEKMGATSVLAVDEDDWSIENSRENILMNNCKATYVYNAGHFPADQRFDLILANINKNVILENLPNIALSLNNPGVLLLSGLLKEDEHDILHACKVLDLVHLNTMQKMNWISVLFTYNFPA